MLMALFDDFEFVIFVELFLDLIMPSPECFMILFDAKCLVVVLFFFSIFASLFM